ncbi:cellulose-binding domain-containing protein [Streptomyces sp. GC420]|uniref:cellulose-binding domain-containing protein n=1 Tax=Streptomyces sp. GC420 TaxID=2697568 RepID=UPI001414F70E|nr:cellulose-binding domain-containing protein [Streptomyces sp. GC420]NBM20294.1 cellulose-binding protein [Streptomyces sp. GC420]
MPDVPTPQDVTEAELLAESWDAVVSYAGLCTTSAAAGTQLATEAFTRGIQHVRSGRGAQDPSHGAAGVSHGAAGVTPSRGPHGWAPRLPRTPLLLIAVRNTAAAWEAHGQGHRIDSGLRRWLVSEDAARHVGRRALRPLALRGLADMRAQDGALLWSVEIEALPVPEVARRLGLDAAEAAEEIARVRGVFRERCHRNHLDVLTDEECRSYARLLDAVTRSPGAGTPEDLAQHLAHCMECAEAASCLRLHGGGLPAALATGVLGWGGLAYLERRHRAVENGLAGPHAQGGVAALPPGKGADRDGGGRAGRAALLAGAAAISVVALVFSLMSASGSAGGSGGDDGSGGRGDTGRQPVAQPAPSFPGPETARPSGPGASSTASPGAPESSPPAAGPEKTADGGTGGKGDSGDTGKSSPTANGSSSREPDDRPGDRPPDRDEDPFCRADYQLVNEWPDGFQATVTVTSRQALGDWQVGWRFRDGQRVSHMWDASFSQSGDQVTARAADYNRYVQAGRPFSIGFIGSWWGRNSEPYAFTLNGRTCATG